MDSFGLSERDKRSIERERQKKQREKEAARQKKKTSPKRAAANPLKSERRHGTTDRVLRKRTAKGDDNATQPIETRTHKSTSSDDHDMEPFDAPLLDQDEDEELPEDEADDEGGESDDEEESSSSEEEAPKKRRAPVKAMPKKKKKKATWPPTAMPKAITISLERQRSGGPAELGDKSLSPFVLDKFLQAWGAHITSIQRGLYKDKKGSAKRKVDRENTDTAHRNLDRVAWVLEKLAPSAVCVAALIDKEAIRIYGNDSSGLAAAIKTLEGYKDSCPLTQTQLDEFAEICGVGRATRGARGGLKWREHLERACSVLETVGLPMRVHDNKTIGKHAEVHAVDVLQKLGQTAKADLGISKLCCAKCYMALYAIGREDLVSGGHFKTAGYGLWALPKFLADAPDDVMVRFLGKAAFAIFETDRLGALRTVTTSEPKGVTGANVTDPVFSDDEDNQ